MSIFVAYKQKLCYNLKAHGGIAQLVERLNGIQEVRDSSSLISTKKDESFCFRLFLSIAKAMVYHCRQAYIITEGVYHQPKVAFFCNNDIQVCDLVIYKTSFWWYPRLCRDMMVKYNEVAHYSVTVFLTSSLISTIGNFYRTLWKGSIFFIKRSNMNLEEYNKV